MNHGHLHNYLKRIAIMMVIFLTISLLSFIVSYLAYSNSGGITNSREITDQIGENSNKISELVSSKDGIDNRLFEVEEKQSQIENRLQFLEQIEAANDEIKNNNQNDETPNPPANEEEIKEPETPAAPLTTGTVRASNLNFRNQAGINAGVIRILTKGEQLSKTGETVSANGYTWVKVKDKNGTLGWVASTYLN